MKGSIMVYMSDFGPRFLIASDSGMNLRESDLNSELCPERVKIAPEALREIKIGAFEANWKWWRRSVVRHLCPDIKRDYWREYSEAHAEVEPVKEPL